MTQYNTLNVKLHNSKLNKLNLEIKNGTEVTLRISSNVVGDSNDENNSLHKLLWTNEQNFVKLLQTVYQLISNYQKLSCIE